MENITLKEYLKHYDYFEEYLTDKYHIFIDNNQFDEYCIEIIKTNEDDSYNIGFCGINENTKIYDIKDIVLNYIIDDFMWK